MVIVPINALLGGNMTQKTLRMIWYPGPTLLGAIDAITPQDHKAHRPNQPDQVCATTSCHEQGVATEVTAKTPCWMSWTFNLHREALCVLVSINMGQCHATRTKRMLSRLGRKRPQYKPHSSQASFIHVLNSDSQVLVSMGREQFLLTRKCCRWKAMHESQVG